MFKKGRLPHNTNPDDYISIRKKYKDKKSYAFIKKNNKMQSAHRYIWEKVNGKIPKGSNIIFIDGNTANLNINNLKCVSNAELMERNSMYQYPKEITDLMRAKGKIKQEIKKQTKK